MRATCDVCGMIDRGANPERLDLMLKTFVSMLDTRSELVDALRTVTDPVLLLPPEVTLHLDLSQQLWTKIKELQGKSGLRSLSDFVRRMLIVMDEDAETAESMRKVLLYAS